MVSWVSWTAKKEKEKKVLFCDLIHAWKKIGKLEWVETDH